MEKKRLKLSIVTPERQIVADEVDQVNVPASEGDFGVLYDHAPILSALRPGPLSYEKDDATVILIVSGGYVEVTENRVTILAETAEFLHEIDRSRAETAKINAEEMLTSGSLDEEAFRDAQLKLFRAIARLESTPEKK